MKGKTIVREVLRAAGLRATRQRVALLEVLIANNVPNSVEDLVHQSKDQMDLATAYRGVQEFERAGIARSMVRKGGSTLYEVADTHHHHVVCRACGLIEDVDVCLPKSLNMKLLATATKFVRIDDHAIEFFGLCRACNTPK